MSKRKKADDREARPKAEEQIEDLDVPADEAEDTKGGRKAGKDQQEYLKVEMKDIIISS